MEWRREGTGRDGRDGRVAGDDRGTGDDSGHTLAGNEKVLAGNRENREGIRGAGVLEKV